MLHRYILRDVAAGVVTLTMNRPDGLNSFNRDMVAELTAALEGAAADASVRCIVLTGAGRAFSAGQDLAEAVPPDGSPAPDIGEIVLGYNQLIRTMRELEKPIVAMVNLDMVGVPPSVNALGDASLVPVLERWHAARPESARLPKGSENLNWVGSDHTPYQLRGIRAVTFNAPIPRESVRYYHDFADTIDKVPPKLIDDSVAVILDVVLALANDAELGAWRRTREDTAKLFTTFGLEKRLRAMGLWPFGD